MSMEAPMTPQLPDWLARRGSRLLLGSDRATWYAILAQQWEYSLAVVPVQGKFACVVRQANNGRQVAVSAAVATSDQALQAGLEELRKALGW